MQIMMLELISLPMQRRRCMFPSDARSAASFSWLIKSGRPKTAASRLAPRLALRLVASTRCRHLDPRPCCTDTDCSCFSHVSTSVGIPSMLLRRFGAFLRLTPPHSVMPPRAGAAGHRPSCTMTDYSEMHANTDDLPPMSSSM